MSSTYYIVGQTAFWAVFSAVIGTKTRGFVQVPTAYKAIAQNQLS